MKYLTAFACCLIICICSGYSQSASNYTNDYVIVSTSNVEDVTPYTLALDEANWEPYRLQNQRYQLSFDNGLIIELKSAVEMVNLGYSLNIPTYRIENPIGFIPPILKLLAGNKIGMQVQTVPNKHY